jgi:hypothetical protein
MVSPSDYDALADLFLAGGGLAADPGIAPQSPFAQTPAPSAVASLSSPFPISASFGASNAPLSHSPTRPFIEGVLLGHLPVFAAGWVTQFAKRLSDERQEPVTLIRTQGGRVEIDLIGSQGPALDSAKPTTVSAAFASAARTSGTWILRVDEPNETTLATLDSIDRLTILTGADDVALAATYRTLKFVVTKMRSASLDLDSKPLGERLRVMVMGATDEKAAEAQDKLQGMMAAFLDTPIEIAVGPQRVSPTLMSSLFRDAAQHDVPQLVALIRNLPRDAAPPSSRIGPNRTLPTPPAIEPPIIQTARLGRIEPRAVDSAEGRHPGGEPVRMNGSGRTAAPSPAVEQETTRVVPAPPQTTDLELVHHVPGLHKLPVSCPYIPEAEIAADSQGRLHLLARTGADRSPGDVVSRLISAAGWLADHLPLIRLALPQTRLCESADDTSLHLFTDQPKAVRRLLDGGVKVHLLASVQVGAAQAWICRELN